MLQLCPRVLECARLLITCGIPDALRYFGKLMYDSDVHSNYDFSCHAHWMQAGLHVLELAISEQDGGVMLRVMDYFAQCLRTVRNVDELVQPLDTCSAETQSYFTLLDIIGRYFEVLDGFALHLIDCAKWDKLFHQVFKRCDKLYFTLPCIVMLKFCCHKYGK